MRIASFVPAAFAAAIVLLSAHAASAQGAPPPYGAPINYATAAKVMAAAEAEAKKNNWNVVISILDSAGQIVMLHRLDNTQYGSIEVAIGKATTAWKLRRPTKVLQDALAQGGLGLRFLTIYPGAVLIDGGILIVADGKIIGAIGVSGVTSEQDAQIAKAGADALGK